MSGDTIATIVGNAIERIERLSFEVGRNSIERIDLRDKMEALRTECQELRDALKEAMQGVRDRKPEDLANGYSETSYTATELHDVLNQYGVPFVGGHSMERLRYALSTNSMLRQQRTTQDG